MENDTKVISESPAAEIVESKPKSSPGEDVISKRDELRRAMEDKVETHVVPSEVIEAEPEKPAETPKEETPVKDDADLKSRIQKRIDKEVAKRKTAEEELVELRAENERLKNSKESPKSETTPGEPTIEQCEAYIIKCREEGDVKNEIAATRYLIKLEKESAIKAVKEEQEATSRKTREISAKQQSDWISLNKDYESSDPDMNLSNQEGRLYKEALKIYKDPDLREVYADPDPIMGFRKAVHDTYRYMMENRLTKKSPSETLDTTLRPRMIKPVLADPDADSAEETTPTVSKNLSDAEKVKEEILNRRKNRNLR